MKQLLIILMLSMNLLTNVLAQTTYSMTPFKAGDQEVAVRVNPADYMRDQNFSLDEEYAHTLNFRGDDFNAYLLVEGYALRFLYEGNPSDGIKKLQYVIERSKVIVISKTYEHFKVQQFAGGFIIYADDTPDPTFRDRSDLGVKVKK